MTVSFNICTCQLLTFFASSVDSISTASASLVGGGGGGGRGSIRLIS